eukprot:5924107-Pleurochrysis_carterae.AAC.1
MPAAGTMINLFAQIKQTRGDEQVALTRKVEVDSGASIQEVRDAVRSRLSDLNFLQRGFSMEMYDSRWGLEYELDDKVQLVNGMNIIVQPSFEPSFGLPKLVPDPTASLLRPRSEPSPRNGRRLPALADPPSAVGMQKESLGPISPLNAPEKATLKSGSVAPTTNLNAVSFSARTLLFENQTRLNGLFAHWDVDGEGVISRKEFRIAVKSLDLPISDEE